MASWNRRLRTSHSSALNRASNRMIDPGTKARSRQARGSLISASASANRPRAISRLPSAWRVTQASIGRG